MGKHAKIAPAGVPSHGANEFSGRMLLLAGAALGITTGVTATLFYSLGAFIPALESANGWSRGDISLAITFATLGLFVSGALVGRLADHFGAAVVGTAGLLLYATVIVGLAWIATDVHHLWLGYFVAAVVGAGSTPVVLVRPISAAFRARRGLALGLALTGGGVAGFWVPLFANSITSGFGWRWGMTALACTAIISAPIVWVGLRSAERPSQRSSEGMVEAGFTAHEARRTLAFWGLSVVGLAMASGVAGLVVHLIPLLRDLGADPARAARLASIVGVTSVVGRILIGMALDRFRPAAVAALVLAASSIGVLLLWYEGLRWAVLSIATLGLAAGAELDLLAFLTARYFGQRAYGAIYGWQYSVFALGYGLSPFLVGRMRDAQSTYAGALVVSAGLIAVAAGAVIAIDAMWRLSPSGIATRQSEASTQGDKYEHL